MTERPDGDVTQDELHAFVDGQLPPDRRRAVEAWLDVHPDAVAQVAAWRAQNAAIRALYTAEPNAAADRAELRNLRVAPPSRPRWRTAAAAALIFAIGGVAGALVYRTMAPGWQVAALPSLPEASRDSYLVYAGEVRHAVEVGADQEQHLVTWLGKRLGTALTAPDLGPLGFRLVGGRLLPIGDAPAAMLMYEDAGGQRVTCLIARDPAITGTGFRFSEREGVSTFSWQDNGLGYALSGPLPRERLLAIANAVYGQI